MYKHHFFKKAKNDTSSLAEHSVDWQLTKILWIDSAYIRGAEFTVCSGRLNQC